MSKLTRRQALKAVAAAGAVTGCLPSSRAKEARGTMKKTDAVVAVTPQGFPWQTSDPFLFCVHHDDHYPRGNERQGPAASLSGRNLGQDFEGKDGWRMYHGEMVPASRCTRTAVSRPSPSCAAGCSIIRIRWARPRATGAATCSG